MNEIAGLFFSLRRKGVRLWLENGILRYLDPQCVLCSEDLDALRARKNEIVSFLERAMNSANAEPPITRRQSDGLVALSFQQQWLRLSITRLNSKRQSIGIALRFIGTLNAEFLRISIETVIRWHDSLRTRIVMVNGIPWQYVDKPDIYILPSVDLPGSKSNDPDKAASDAANKLLSESPELHVGPLFRACLFRLGARDHVLVVALHHIVCDAVSLEVLRRQIIHCYLQLLGGRAISAPGMSVQYPDYAQWQQRTQDRWAEYHEAYWVALLRGANRLRPPRDVGIVGLQRFCRRSISIIFGDTLTAELRVFAGRERTTLAMCALATYIVLMSLWCSTLDVLIPVFVMGRHRSEIRRTIGLFSFPLFIRVQLSESDSLMDVLRRLHAKYAEAERHADFGRLAVRGPHFRERTSAGLPPLYRRRPRNLFHWKPWRSGNESRPLIATKSSGESNDKCEILPFNLRRGDAPRFELDVLLVFSETVKSVTGECFYRADLFHSNTMAGFRDTFMGILRTLLENPHCTLFELPFLIPGHLDITQSTPAREPLV